MRTWGRVVPDPEFAPDVYKWVQVDLTPQGLPDYIWLTTLIQCLKLNLGESPFYSNYGIPARQSVITQLFPDFYVSQTQQQFSKYFASLTVAKQINPTPSYNIGVMLNNGTTLETQVPV